MTDEALVEKGDHWVLPLSGEMVSRCCYDYAFTLILGASPLCYVLTIEGAFSLHGPDGTEGVYDLENARRGMSATLRLLHTTVTRAVAYKDGRLTIDVDDGSRVRVPASYDYEAWQVTGPDGLRVVATAGGGVTLWT